MRRTPTLQAAAAALGLMAGLAMTPADRAPLERSLTPYTVAVAWRTGGPERPVAGVEVDDPDFNMRSLRGNAVLRWEYRPGSALFFVWQQERSGFEALGGFDAGRDVGRLFREPARNVFLIKATWWIG